jgi:hypothetical protein
VRFHGRCTPVLKIGSSGEVLHPLDVTHSPAFVKTTRPEKNFAPSDAAFRLPCNARLSDGSLEIQYKRPDMAPSSGRRGLKVQSEENDADL